MKRSRSRSFRPPSMKLSPYYYDRLLLLGSLLAVVSRAFVPVPIIHSSFVGYQTQTCCSSLPSSSSLSSSTSSTKDNPTTGVTKNGTDSSSASIKNHKQTAFKAWPEGKIVSHGDYMEETWLEDYVGGPLYAAQKDLPLLPVPTLEDTIRKLLSSGMPLGRDERETQDFSAALQQFPEQAQPLQQRLVQHAQSCQQQVKRESWLQKWWQQQGYLQGRHPVSPCVSYFLFVPDDDTLPPRENPGVARAAAALYAMAEARKQICSGTMSHENIGTDVPLCSTGFKYLFHGTRIPQRHQDVFHMYDPSKYSHVVVATRGQFFAVDFCDPLTADPLPLTVLEQRLQLCQDMAENTMMNEPNIQMGWLTSCNRDVWADARQELLHKGGDKMKRALETLESGAFVLNLDEDEPETITDAAKTFWYGGTSSRANRWHDKAIQIVCTKNGKMAYLGEHSMLDAAPVIPLIRRIIKTSYKKLSNRGSDAQQQTTNNKYNIEDGVKNIFGDLWDADNDLTLAATKLTAVAEQHHYNITSKYEVNGMVFHKFGKKFLRANGFDANDVVQMALQLASYRMFGEQVGTYEAALTRTFLHGRTETTRPVSFESNLFVEIMTDFKDVVREDKIAALKRATEAHAEYSKEAFAGHGVDRHLFGLQNMMILEENKYRPILFDDPIFKRARNWRLSTSAVIFCPGFGPSADDGIGVGYMIGSDALQFTLTSLKKNTFVDKFAKLLDEALTDIGDLFDGNSEF